MPEARRCLSRGEPRIRRLLRCGGGGKMRRGLPRWVPVLSSAVSVALLLLVFRPVFVKQIPVRPRVADAFLANILETAPSPVKRFHRRRVSAPKKTPNANWGIIEPAIRIAIPVEAMFPPVLSPRGSHSLRTSVWRPTVRFKDSVCSSDLL